MLDGCPESRVHDSGDESILVRPSLRSENCGLPEYNRAPKLGEHTREVLLAEGYTEEQIQQMIDDGAAKQYEK